MRPFKTCPTCDRPSWGGSEESWADYVESCCESFRSPSKRTEWDKLGDVDGAFCRNCGSHFCPHVMPSMYPSPVTGREYDQLAKLLEAEKRTGVTTRPADYPPVKSLAFAKLADGMVSPVLSRGFVKRNLSTAKSIEGLKKSRKAATASRPPRAAVGR